MRVEEAEPYRAITELVILTYEGETIEGCRNILVIFNKQIKVATNSPERGTNIYWHTRT